MESEQLDEKDPSEGSTPRSVDCSISGLAIRPSAYHAFKQTACIFLPVPIEGNANTTSISGSPMFSSFAYRIAMETVSHTRVWKCVCTVGAKFSGRNNQVETGNTHLMRRENILSSADIDSTLNPTMIIRR